MSAKAPGRSQFWLRKLHSLTGFIFIGYFLCLHVRGSGGYDSDFFRVAFLWIPLAFHAIYGAYICYEAQPNNLRYSGYIRNWMYMLQRATAFIIVPFLIVHVGAEQYGWSLGEWYPAFWYVGVVTAVFHLANGIFGTFIDWGITVGPHSQRVFVGVSFVSFIVLCGYGLYTLSTGGYY
jgi:succinate dehydrogenase / fumarate reductase cytochrome b subunit